MSHSGKIPPKSDLPARISEMEGTLRQLGVPDFQSMQLRRDCLENRRQRLQKEGPSLALTALNQEISQLDQSLGQKTMVSSCGDRLFKLRKDREEILRNQRLQRAKQQQSQKELTQHLAIVEQAAKFFLKDGLGLCLYEGGNSPGCRILKDGIPYENLSRREQAKAQLGIHRFLTVLFDVRYPVFLDDWEKDLLPEGNEGQFIALCRNRRENELVMKPWQ